MRYQDASQILQQNYAAAGQGHVFRYFDQLGAREQRALLEQAATIDLDEITALVDLHLKGGKVETVDYAKLEPAPYAPLPSNEDAANSARWEQAREAGEKALRQGEVAAFTVAGGQGTRLGYDGPKGTYPTAPISKRSLFEIFARKIARAGERYGKAIPWYILTSQINHAETVGFFDQNGFFGLDPAKVHFFSQGLMPAVDRDGKIILAGKDTIAMSPDGHGGSLRALVRSGAIARMEREGSQYISYFQVDNPLVRCIDPAFIGFHILENSELSSKMTTKAYPSEKVGHFCIYQGKHVVIEYSDLPTELAEQTLEDGSLRFTAGSIAIHIFGRDFVKRVGSGETDAKLPFHRADKKIPCVDPDGNTIKPESPNGIKFEMFVFDALPLAKNPVIIETARNEDFSPVKNASGIDSPDSCRADLLRQSVRWLAAAGTDVATDDEGLPTPPIEIDPRFAMDLSDFVERWPALKNKPSLTEPTIIG